MEKNYALVLWWWGWRWYAHIWVIRYIEEKNINITQTAWTSMWAIISACFAIWKTSEEMENILKNINFLKLLDLDFKYWVMSWKKVYNFLHEIFWDTLIENTKIPLKIVATDLNSWWKKVFDSWKIIDAIRASISIPAVFAPYETNWHKYIDWWLRSNLPIWEVNENNVIAVSVVREKLEIKTHRKFFSFSIKKWFLWNNYEILKKSFSIIMANNEDLTLEIATRDWKNIILIKPDVSKYEYHDFMKYDEIIKKWYESCENIKF